LRKSRCIGDDMSGEDAEMDASRSASERDEDE
jgi:hypothetical protein